MENVLDKITEADKITKVSIIINCFLVIFLIFSFAIRDDSNNVMDSNPRELVIFRDGDSINGGTYDKVTISRNLKDGSALIKRATIDELIINGGGENTIIIEDSKIKNIVVDKEGEEPVRVLFLGETEVENFESKTNTILESEGDKVKLSNFISEVDELLVEFRKINIDNLNVSEKVLLVKDNTSKIRNIAKTNKIKVLFLDEEGKTIEEREISRGESVSSLAYEKDGFTFKGWELDGKEFNFSNVVLNSMRLKPILKEIIEEKETPQAPSSPAPTPTRPSPSPSPTQPKPEPKPDPEPVIKYTFTQQSLPGSTAVRITAFRNGTQVSITEVMDSSGNRLGSITDQGYVTTDGSLVSLIRKARLTSGEVIDF